MKWIIVLLMTFLIAPTAFAQITVTNADVELQFVIDPTGQWRSVDIVSIEYSFDPVASHNPKGRLGVQVWEFLLQVDEPDLGKCIVTFNLDSLPSPTFRGHIVRIRVRDGILVSDWESNNIRVFGNPGKPVYKRGE